MGPLNTPIECRPMGFLLLVCVANFNLQLRAFIVCKLKLQPKTQVILQKVLEIKRYNKLMPPFHIEIHGNVWEENTSLLSGEIGEKIGCN